MNNNPPMASDAYAKDAIIAWFRGEFAAANAMIDALCNHLTQVEGGRGSLPEYESVFSAIHRRRMNWIPILQMQKYYSIADVEVELKKVAAKKTENNIIAAATKTAISAVVDDVIVEHKNCDIEMKISSDDKEKEIVPEDMVIEEKNENENEKLADEDDSPESDITDSGSQEVQPMLDNIDLCNNHADCEARRSLIKMTKGFTAKEHVNVVRGLKLYENVLSDSELSKIKNFVNELRVAGQNGELPGGSYDS
ncbi:hypothetical protein Leryth_013790 [Lithospermum erythrorhizon]|nr:hypothetical protein Leryth_013790 [Lithospermum erythrorhizon]